MKLRVYTAAQLRHIINEDEIAVPYRLARWLGWNVGDSVEITTKDGHNAIITNTHAGIRRALQDRRRTPEATQQRQLTRRLAKKLRLDAGKPSAFVAAMKAARGVGKVGRR